MNCEEENDYYVPSPKPKNPSKIKGFSYKRHRNQQRRIKKQQNLDTPPTPPKPLSREEIRQLEIESDMRAAYSTFF